MDDYAKGFEDALKQCNYIVHRVYVDGGRDNYDVGACLNRIEKIETPKASMRYTYHFCATWGMDKSWDGFITTDVMLVGDDYQEVKSHLRGYDNMPHDFTIASLSLIGQHRVEENE
jgi:hypothetical protein